MNNRNDIIEKIVAKKMRSDCEVCGNSNWLVPQGGNPDVVLALTMQLVEDSTRGVSFVPMICQTCSNTRMLHLETLLKD